MELNAESIINKIERNIKLWKGGSYDFGGRQEESGVVLREIFDDEIESLGNVNNLQENVVSSNSDFIDREHLSDRSAQNRSDLESESWTLDSNVSYHGYESSFINIFDIRTWSDVYVYWLGLFLSIAIKILSYLYERTGRFVQSILPPVTPANLAAISVISSVAVPSIISNYVIYPCCRLLFGTLYPAYASYKAVRTKNVKEYVKWMMYWIVFALFTCAETFTDVFFSWFPFYYEIKILIVVWLLSPATKGSSILYRKFVHPALCRREQEIDEYISKAKDQGYHTVLNLGTKGVNYATNVIMQTAIKGGGGLVQQLRKSYSLSDLSIADDRADRSQQELDEVDDIVSIGEHRVVRRSIQGRTPKEVRGPRTMSAPRMDMIFSEVDMDRHSGRSSTRDSPNLSHIRSSEDISGPYPTEKSSSQDTLTRTASVGGARTRSKVVRSTFTSIKRPGAAEDEDLVIEELDDDLPAAIQNIPSSLFSEGTICLPNSNDMLFQYLRHFMEKEQEVKENLDGKFEDEYENYLKLKAKFESNVKCEKENDISEAIKRHVDGSSDYRKTFVEGKEFVDELDVVKSLSNSTTSEIIHGKDSSLVSDTSNVEFDKNMSVAIENNDNVPLIVEDTIKFEEISGSPKSDIVLDLKDGLVPEVSLVQSCDVTIEVINVNASSSTLNSDDELDDFTTPNSSPKMQVKLKRKRQAPLPPQALDDVSKKATTGEQMLNDPSKNATNKVRMVNDASKTSANEDKMINDNSKKAVTEEQKVNDISKITVTEEQKVNDATKKAVIEEHKVNDATKKAVIEEHKVNDATKKAVIEEQMVNNASKTTVTEEHDKKPAEEVEKNLKNDKAYIQSKYSQKEENAKYPETVKETVLDVNTKSDSSSPKLGHKSISPLSKLMQLPGKLSFWNLSDESKKGHAKDKPIKKEASALSVSSVTTDIRSSRQSIGSESSFHDACDSEQSIDQEIKKDNKTGCENPSEPSVCSKAIAEAKIEAVIDNKDYVYIPLSIATLSVNSESKSTDV